MIQLPGFEVIVPNAAFMNNLTDPISREIIVLEKYFEQTHDQVFAYFMEKFRKIQSGQKPQTVLEKMIADLPKQYARELAEDPELINLFILGHTCENPQYSLAISYGDIPLDYFFSEEETTLNSINKLLMSEETRQQGLGERWNISLPISDGFLPPLVELLILIKHRKGFSDIHTCDSEELNLDQSDEMVGMLPIVYQALSKSNYLDSVPTIEKKELRYIMAETSFGLFLQHVEDQKKQRPGYFKPVENPN